MDNQPVEKAVNPLLERVKMPGETFTLPSGGLFYGDGVLDPSVSNAEVHVHPMTTLDEITMKSPDMLFSGKAVQEVFTRCIPQVLAPGKLLSKDVDFLLAALRKVSYGDEMTIEFDHDCKDHKKHSYMVDVTRFVQSARRIDPTTVEKEYSVTFTNGQTAKFQPVIFDDYISIMQALSASTNEDSPESVRDEMVKSLAGLIRQVDEVTDKEQITEWLREVPPMFVEDINKRVDQVSQWGADFTATIKCLDCGKTVEAEVPLNPLSFFLSR